MLSRYNFSTEIFGAFPVPRGAKWQKLRATTILLVSKTLNLIPKGKIIKDFLNKVVIGKTLIFKEEIEEISEHTGLIVLERKNTGLVGFENLVLESIERLFKDQDK